MPRPFRHAFLAAALLLVSSALVPIPPAPLMAADALGTVRLSVKRIRGPGEGETQVAPEVEESILSTIRASNDILERSGAIWRLELVEIVPVSGLEDFFEIDSVRDVIDLERAARGKPRFGWRFDAINLYIADRLWPSVAGYCSFPSGHEGTHETIVVSQITPRLWLHEIGHYLSLLHTFHCTYGGGRRLPDGSCDILVCAGEGAIHRGAEHVRCPDVCDVPLEWNLMSYERVPASRVQLTACQLREMQIELCSPDGSRRHVYEPPLAEECIAPCSAPLDLRASQGDFEDRIELRWQGKPEDTAYHVFRATEARFDSIELLATTSATKLDDEDVVRGTLYWYWVQTACGDDSAPSALAGPTMGFSSSEGVPSPPLPFERGDANDDGRVDLTDAIFMAGYLFLGGSPLHCSDAGDSNDDGSLDLSDVIFALSFLFDSGPDLPAPHPACGNDPTHDALDCRKRQVCDGPGL